MSLRRLGATVGAVATLLAGAWLLAAPGAVARPVAAPAAAAPAALNCGTSPHTCVAPLAPRLTQSRCPQIGTRPLRPRLVLRHSTGIVYAAHPQAPYTAGQRVRVTATAQHGFVFTRDPVSGWTRVSGIAETYHVLFDAAPTCIETQPPGFTDDHCVDSAPTTARYAIADTPGVVYYVDSLLTAAGSYPAIDGSTIAVVARPVVGVTLVGATSWSHTFATTPSCVGVVEPTAPSFVGAGCGASAHYTVPATSGVSYRVNGTAVAAGTYRAATGSTLTIVAMARPGHTLQGTTSWTHTFVTAAHCGSVGTTTGSHHPLSSGSGPVGNPATVLADTGSDTGLLIAIGLTCVGVGAGLSTAGRCRSASAGR